MLCAKESCGSSNKKRPKRTKEKKITYKHTNIYTSVTHTQRQTDTHLATIAKKTTTPIQETHRERNKVEQTHSIEMVQHTTIQSYNILFSPLHYFRLVKSLSFVYIACKYRVFVWLYEFDTSVSCYV